MKKENQKSAVSWKPSDKAFPGGGSDQLCQTWLMGTGFRNVEVTGNLEGINDFNWTVIWAEPDKFIGTCFSNRLKHHKEKFR